MSVPSIMVRACGEIGATRVDGEAAIAVEELEAKVSQPVDPGERQEDIREAMEVIVERNAREDFTAAGMPVIKVVSAQVGYKVDRNEVTKAWRQRAEDIANDSE